MRIAFYAPLKPIDHLSPSGDRRVGRAFFELLCGLGHDVRTACHLRTFDGTGDRQRQERLARLGRRCGTVLQRRYTRSEAWRPDLWFTYHLYHKSPDWLGPDIARQLGIPYVVAEPSIAEKRRAGAWSPGFAGAAQAVDAADALLVMTRKDLNGLTPRLDDRAKARLFPPFLDQTPFAEARERRAKVRATLAWQHGIDPSCPWLLVVAMMRDDVKKASYLTLADVLRRLRSDRWQLVVIGDGRARTEIEAAIVAAAGARAHCLGGVAADRLPGWFAAADLFAWPALNEAYGMAMLEAQAAGLPVVAFAEGGVADIVDHGRSGVLVEGRSAEAMAFEVDRLLVDAERRERMGREAVERVARHHSLEAARERLATVLASVARPAPPARSVDACG